MESPKRVTTRVEPRYKRILLKLSGEVLMGEKGFGIDAGTVSDIADEIRSVHELSVQVGVVVGGGNIFRGLSTSGKEMDRVSADHMGMLATVINGLALQDALEKRGIFTRVATAIEMRDVAEPFIRRRAIRHLEKGRVLVFAAGTGNPYFTTDTAAVLRAMEVRAEIIFKATKVDGIYTADPEIDPHAEKIARMTHKDVLDKDLRVMDATAIALCRENRVPIQIFNVRVKGNIRRAALGEPIGSVIEV